MQKGLYGICIKKIFLLKQSFMQKNICMHKFPPTLQILLSQSGYKPETIDDQKQEKNNNHVHVTVRNSLNRINKYL